jgi:hypothetical protein
VEGRELDAVAVYFTDVEVGADRVDVLLRNVVCGTPDLFGGFMLLWFVSVEGRDGIWGV